MNSDPPPISPEELLTPARAAAIARRSVRTIRRAYTSGRLTAFRDGGGRGVRIRYHDLRGWMMREEVVPPHGTSPAAPEVAKPGEHMALIRSARQRRAS